MAESPPGPQPIAARTPALVVLAGSSLAVAALLAAAVTGPPYLGSAGVNGWIAAFAAGLLAAVEGGLVAIAVLAMTLSGGARVERSAPPCVEHARGPASTVGCAG